MNRQTCFLLLGRTLWIATRQNRLAVTCCELLLCPKETRHQEVKQRPQLQHIVLYRSSWQNEPVVCDQQLDRFRGLPQKWEKLTWDLIFILLHYLFHNWRTAIKSHRTWQGKLKRQSLHCCVQLLYCTNLMLSILLHRRLQKIASVLRTTGPLFIIAPHHLM